MEEQDESSNNDLFEIDISVEKNAQEKVDDENIQTTSKEQEKDQGTTMDWKIKFEKVNSQKEKILSRIPKEELAALSKNQLKKLVKKKLLEETRKEKRRHERERKKVKRKELKEAGLELPRRLKLRHFKDLKYSNYKVVIDLDFYDFMLESDSRMVSKQANACYALNRVASNPLQLYATSFCGPMKDLFIKLQPGCVHWTMNFEESNYADVFPLDKIVYLTSDSENTLETLEEDKVYVIGGIVDHNQHKGLCHKLAVEKGVAHAQLPISQYVNMATRKVLTINHVFGILSKYLDTQDWKKAFSSVLPKRKGVSLIDESDSTATMTSEDKTELNNIETIVDEKIPVENPLSVLES